MQLTLDRSRCGHHPAACEGCLATYLQHGVLPERGCLGHPVEDGRPEITIRIKSGTFYGTLVVTEENREEIIYHGWMQFAQLPPEAFIEQQAAPYTSEPPPRPDPAPASHPDLTNS